MSDSVGDEGLVPVALYDEEAAAEQAARALVARGIGAVVRVITPEARTLGSLPDTATTEVVVLPTELVRASAVLGFDLADRPDLLALTTSAEPGDGAEKPPFPWRKVLLIWAAAMILVPLAVFYLTYNTVG